MLGLPGAGKGTQAALLAASLGVPHIATGNMFRQAVAAGSPLGQKVGALLAAGELVPDGLTVAVVGERLGQPDCASGFILDGFPRTLAQGEALDHLLLESGTPLQHALYLEIAEERAVARLAGRRTCTSCGATYHVQTDPPGPGGLCRRCGQPVATRPDDAPEVQRRRIDAYRRDTEPLLGFYRGQGHLLLVDADRPPAEITRDLTALLRAAPAGGLAG